MKSGIVTFDESKHVPSEAMKERSWVLGGESVIELYEYKTLLLYKTLLGYSPPTLMIKLGKCRYVFFLELGPAEGQHFNLH